MTLRIYISICMLIFSILYAQAQLNKEDSTHLKKIMESKEEIIINQEAVKSIEFNFMPREEILGQKPMIAEEKPWMKFIKKLPKEFIRKEIPELEINFDPKFDKLTKQSAPLKTFDTDKFLYETFTKQGRTLKHNREHATAWKTYKDYLPTVEDSIKWYRNKKRILKDTLAIVTDSAKNHFINTK